MLAAGVQPVGGLGARAIYGDRQLTARERNIAWMLQQKIIQVANESNEAGGEPGVGGLRTDVNARRALRLEKQGKLRDDMDPDEQRPDWLPKHFDPGPM